MERKTTSSKTIVSIVKKKAVEGMDPLINFLKHLANRVDFYEVNLTGNFTKFQ